MENHVNGINFKAIPLNQTKIQAFNSKKDRFVPVKATFVKIDANNGYDLKAIEVCNAKWQTLYMKRITTASHWMNSNPIDIYAITTQEKNYTRLNPNKILGFAEIRPDDNDKRFTALYRLQVSPEAINIDNSSKKYKEVGSSILTSLKKYYESISLFIEKGSSLDKYYKKRGFVRDYKDKTRFLWCSNPLKKLLIHYENLCKRFVI